VKSSRFVGVFLRQCTNSRGFVVLPGGFPAVSFTVIKL